MKPAAFAYHAPKSVPEALSLLRSLPDAKVLAGGQSLMPLLNLRLAHPGALVDVNRIAQLAEVRRESGRLLLGALTRHADLGRDARVQAGAPLLALAARQIGHPAIRNRGTLGGSLAHADPAAELPAALLAHGGEIRLASADGERSVPAADFFLTTFTTVLEPDELLLGVAVPEDPSPGCALVEFARRPGDFALAGAAVLLHAAAGRLVDVRIALFGVADRPLRCAAAERRLEGVALAEAPAVLREVAALALEGVSPLSDLHAQGPYRAHLGRVAVRRALEQALARLVGDLGDKEVHA